MTPCASKTSISLGTFSHLFNAMCRGFALKGCNFGGRSAQHHASGSSKRVLNNIGLRTGWNVVGFRFVPCSYSVRTCSYRGRTMFVHARTRFEQCSGWTPIIRVPNYEGLDCKRFEGRLKAPNDITRSTMQGYKALSLGFCLHVVLTPSPS